MGMGFSPTWLRQVSPPLHKTTLTTDYNLRRSRASDGFIFFSDLSFASVMSRSLPSPAAEDDEILLSSQSILIAT